MSFGRPLRATELCEMEAREFLGDEWWKRMKQHYDDCMSYRKTLKGKPTDEQRIQLECNAHDIKWLGRVLWHSDRMARHDRCVCTGCAKG